MQQRKNVARMQGPAQWMLSVLKWTVECFNMKIKMALLILIWTLIIFRMGECTYDAVKSNKNNNRASNLYKQMKSNIIGDNEVINQRFPAQLSAVEQWTVAADARRSLESDQFSAFNETLNSFEGGWRSTLERKLFVRDAAGEQNGQVDEAMQAAVAASALDPGDETTMVDTKYAKSQRTYEMQATFTTTMAAEQATTNTNVMAAAMNSDVGKINEYQNVRNNENENDKRAKVVDSVCATTESATTSQQQTVDQTTTNTFTETPATAGVAGATTYTPATREEQKMAANATQTAVNDEAQKRWSHSDTMDEMQPLNVDETAAPAEPTPLDVTAALQQQLIYEFAIKYKHIPRVTFFTCRRLSGQRVEGNTFGGQQMPYLNKQTMEILKRMYGTKVADKTRSAAGVEKPNIATTTTPPITATAAPVSVAPTAPTAATTHMTSAPSKATDINVEKVRGVENGSGQSNATSSDVTGKTTNMINGNTPQRGKRSASRVIPVDAAAVPSPWDILIKVVHIDQLINERPTVTKNKNNKNNNNNNNNRYSYNSYAQRTIGTGFDGGFGGGGGRGYGRSAGAGAGSRNANANANWLAQVLRADGSRQVVVLNLACGAASRRLLETASNKALFNSTYHWLLIEDYTFNRQTGIDSNDKSERQNNEEVGNYNNNNNNNNNNNDGNDNDSNDGNFFQQTQSQQWGQQKTSDTATVGSVANARTLAVTAPLPSSNNEADMEIIEKYLEKINININTELILAKRHTRRIRDDDDDDDDDNAATAERRKVRGADRGCCCTSNSESATNNTLQRKDYYQLYDVWSPGLQYGGQLNISEIGYFALDDGLQIARWYRRSTTITRRMDMKMARIRCLIVVTNKNDTHTLEHYLTTHYDTHLDSMNRFNFALLTHVRQLFNFSFVLSKTASWGYLKNGKFDGMIGALVRKQTDIGGSPIFFRIERAKVIDYTTRTWVARPCFIFRHPPSTKKDRIVFLQPFSNAVWILLGFCGIFTICLLWLLTTVERRLETFSAAKQLSRQSARGSDNSNDAVVIAAAATAKQQSAISGNDELPGHGRTTWTATSGSTMHCCNSTSALLYLAASTKAQRKQKLEKLANEHTTAERKNVKHISCRPCMLDCGSACCGQTGSNVAQQRSGLFFDSVLFYVSSICQQGLTFSTSFFSGRCIVITSLLFAFAIYQFYSASIVGTLLMEKPKTIRTLRDLIHSSLEVGVEDIAYNRDYFLRTKDPVAIELYAKKVTSVPMTSEALAEPKSENVTAATILAIDKPGWQPTVELTEAQKSKAYRDILHSHERGAHAKTNDASNWYDPDFGVNKIRKGKFAFHVDVATAYKIIADTFNEKEICELTEIQLFPPQKMVSIVQKGSPLRKMITYGLRRVTETGLMDYQRKVWHSPKPRCVKQIHTDDLRVDLQTFASALLVLIFGYAVSLLALSIELIQHKLWQQRYNAELEE